MQENIETIENTPKHTKKIKKHIEHPLKFTKTGKHSKHYIKSTGEHIQTHKKNPLPHQMNTNMQKYVLKN